MVVFTILLTKKKKTTKNHTLISVKNCLLITMQTNIVTVTIKSFLKRSPSTVEQNVSILFFKFCSEVILNILFNFKSYLLVLFCWKMKIITSTCIVLLHRYRCILTKADATDFEIVGCTRIRVLLSLSDSHLLVPCPKQSSDHSVHMIFLHTYIIIGRVYLSFVRSVTKSILWKCVRNRYYYIAAKGRRVGSQRRCRLCKLLDDPLAAREHILRGGGGGGGGAWKSGSGTEQGLECDSED